MTPNKNRSAIRVISTSYSFFALFCLSATQKKKKLFHTIAESPIATASSHHGIVFDINLKIKIMLVGHELMMYAKNSL